MMEKLRTQSEPPLRYEDSAGRRFDAFVPGQGHVKAMCSLEELAASLREPGAERVATAAAARLTARREAAATRRRPCDP